MKNFFIIFFLVLIGCTSAKQSSEVHAVRAPVAPYLKMTCGELFNEQQLVLRDVEASGIEVDKEYDSEKTTELVTWILFAPAAFWLEGNDDEQNKLAAYKGQLDAINEALKINKCTEK